MHERAVMDRLLHAIVDAAQAEGAGQVTRIHVRLGALSHFTPDHFRDHFRDASRGTVAEGADVEATLSEDPTHPDAQGVVLASIEVELEDPSR